MKTFKNFSISTKILGITLILSVVSQLAIAFIAYSHIKKIGNYSQTAANNLGQYSSKSSETALQEQAEEYLTKLSKALADASDVSLNEISGQVSGISASLEEIYKNKDNFNARAIETSKNASLNLPFEKAYIFDDNNTKNGKNDELDLVVNAFYTIKPIYSGSSTISAIYFGTESGIKYEFSANNEVRYDPRLRDWYKDAKNTKIDGKNETVWQNIYEDIVTGNPCITCSKAFCDSNENILGVVAIDVQLENIKNFLTNIKTEATKHAFILDKNGEIVISENDKIKNFGLENKECESVLLNMLDGKTGTEKINLNGAEYYISYSTMKAIGWSVGTINEYDEIIKNLIVSKNLINAQTAETESTINSNIKTAVERFFMVFFVCMGISLVLGIFMIEKIVRPIRKVKKSLKKIGKGNLDVELPVETEDEIGKLCSEFNKMTKNLKGYIENLAKTTAEKEKIKSELNIAKKIQHSMLPYIFPAFPERTDFDIYAIMEPAKEVGGDFYDFFFIDKNHLALVIADISDKGISAALFMVIAKILIKNQLQDGSSPAEVFEIINNKLCENNEASMFVTAFTGIFNLSEKKFTYANAGHNLPFLYKKAENKFEILKSKSNFVLGAIPNMKYQNQTLDFSSNDALFMYTDGVTDAMNPAKEFYSAKRLDVFLNECGINKFSLKEFINKIYENVKNFENGSERADDITMLLFKYLNQ